MDVTVPVNVAVHLARKGQKCLLIDLDTERDAISKVFEVDSSRGESGAVSTNVSGLWLWPGRYFTTDSGKTDITGLKDVIYASAGQYDRLIIYAPNIRQLTDTSELAGCVDSAMLFGADEHIQSSSIIDFRELLTRHNCGILEPRKNIISI